MELENTDKEITLVNILKDIDGEKGCERGHFCELVKEMTQQGYDPNRSLSLANMPLNFFPAWLKSNPRAVPWLISHGYAKEREKEFKPFVIEVNTKENAEDLKLALTTSPVMCLFYARIRDKLNKALEG